MKAIIDLGGKKLKAHTLGKILTVIKGTIIQGNSDILIKDVARYYEHIEQPNTLLFLVQHRNIDFKRIAQYCPCAVVVDREVKELKKISGCIVIRVSDIDDAYDAFIHFYRQLFDIPVVAVTGTSGKTTTKDMIKHILSTWYKVEGTVRSANGNPRNLIYLLRIDDSIQAAVYESAVGAPGDITYTCSHFLPNIGIITNIGIDHLERCKTLQGYINAKAEMVSVIPEGGTLILNADDEKIKTIDTSKCKGNIIYFGIDTPCLFQASNITYGNNGMNFTLTLNKMKYQIFVPGYGKHQVYNALAALAATHEMGIGITQAAQALSSFKLLMNHCEIKKGLNQATIIDDTWNINTASLKAAMNTLCELNQQHKKVALIGHIKQLGEHSADYHKEVGKMIAKFNIDYLITIGDLANNIATECSLNVFHGKVFQFEQTEGVYELLSDILNEETTLLIKCSMFDYDIKELTEQIIKG